MTSSAALTGDLRIYTVPRALIRHVQWSLNQIFGYPVQLEWQAQKMVAGCMSAELQWRSGDELASKIASTLKSWHYLRFEVREFPTSGGEGVLYRCTPDLGLHQAVTASSGDIMIHENRVLTSLQTSRGYESLKDSIEAALGIAWDKELECYRLQTQDQDWLHQVSM
jgi:hypothetical protein